MTDLMTDPVLDRLRAADPAAADPAFMAAPPDPARVTAARRRRTGARAARIAVPGTALAAAAVVAALVPAGSDGGLAVADVVARAAAAADVPSNRIVVTQSEVDARWSDGGLWQRKTVWVRVGADGKPVAVRSLVTDARGERTEKGVEDVSYRDADGRKILKQRDPRTGEVKQAEGEMVPSLIFQAQALLERARRGEDAQVRLDGETTFGGHRALRLVVTGVQDPALPGDRDELLVDAESYAPLAVTHHSEGTAVNGKPFVYDLTERVVAQRVLPDDAAHREQLELGGPTG